MSSYHLPLPKALAALALVVLALAAVWGFKSATHQGTVEQTPPLQANLYSPVGLIGSVVALGTSTVTIEGQPPGNDAPVRLEAVVDENTNIIVVGPAPEYATTTGAFSDFKQGMLLNMEAGGATVENGMRHADRIIVPPAE